MARYANNSSHFIHLAAGAAVGTGAFTAVSVARVVTYGTHRALISARNAVDHNRFLFYVGSSGNLILEIQGAAGVSSATVPLDGWALVAVSKASGSAAIRLHIHTYATGAWSRSNSASSSIASLSSPITSFTIANRTLTGSYAQDVHHAAHAFYDRQLSDAELDRLPYSLAAWLAAGPAAMWVLDQHSTATAVRDLTGGGANQTSISGTSVSTVSVPVLSYGHPIIAATRDGAGAGGDRVTSGTARAVATATATVTTTRTTTGTAGAAAAAGGATTTTRTTTGVARAVATASAATSKQATTTGTAAATASAQAAHSTDRYTAGVARAVATATAVTSQSGSHTTTGTARAVAGATAAVTTTRLTTGTGRTVAAGQAVHTTSRATTGAALALAGAHATTATSRVTSGAARAVATASAIVGAVGQPGKATASHASPTAHASHRGASLTVGRWP